MRDIGVVIVIVAAGFIAWLAITNRLKYLGSAWEQLVGMGAGLGVPSLGAQTAFSGTNTQPLSVGRILTNV